MSQLTAESDAIQRLLAEVRQTICDNKRFLKRLKEDGADPEPEDEASGGGEDGEEDFEEL